jgi:hypothetical protein
MVRAGPTPEGELFGPATYDVKPSCFWKVAKSQ